MKLFPYSKQPFHIEVYRTDEAIFLRSLSVASEIKQYYWRLCFKTTLAIFCIVYCFAFLTKGVYLEVIFVSVFFA
ncbi:MAG: hypothetical protein LBJ67_19360, partial [Planctomycetaceae bacterium]|nr:hypothetical protein [Planctomycetaceae bacterium]